MGLIKKNYILIKDKIVRLEFLKQIIYSLPEMYVKYMQR